MRAFLGAGLATLLLLLPANTAWASDEPELVEQIVGSGGSIFLRRGDPELFRGRPRLELRRVDPPPTREDPGRVRTTRARRGHGDDLWQFRMGDATPGLYTVKLRYRSGRVHELPGPLEVRPPEVDEPTLLPYRKGRQLTIGGRYFGPRRFTLRLGDRRMRLRGRRNPGNAATIIPLRFPRGDYRITVSNAAGSATTANRVRIGSPLFQYSRLRPKHPRVRTNVGILAGDTFEGFEGSARRYAPDVVEVTVHAYAAGAKRRLVFTLPDVFGHDIDEPLLLRAPWAVVRGEDILETGGKRLLDWAREDALIVTILAYDHRSGYFAMAYDGGLHATDRFGLPRDGPSLQLRGGRVGVQLRGPFQKGVNGFLDVDVAHPDVVDAAATTAAVEDDLIVPAPRERTSVYVTQFLAAPFFDPVLPDPDDHAVAAAAPSGSAVLVEVQAAPPLHPARRGLDSLPDTTVTSPWTPAFVLDQTGDPDGAFAARGLPRSVLGPDGALPLAHLSEQGYRHFRFRVTLVADPDRTPSDPVPRVFFMGLAYHVPGDRR